MDVYRTNSQFCAWNLYFKRKKYVCSRKFHRILVDKYGKHTVYTDGGTWYPQVCTFLHLKHGLHSHLDKSLIERVMQYFKDRTECLDDYYSCVSIKRRNCNLQHVYNWIKLFVYLYNSKIRNTILFKIGGEIVNLKSPI